MQGSTAVLWVVLAPLFSVFVPAQAKQVGEHVSRHVSHMSIETHEDMCMGLSPAECCAQSLEVAVFHATGDQLPKAAKLPVRLSCADPAAVVPEGACRSIAMARGLAAKDVTTLCTTATLTKRCDADASCKVCTRELAKLKFQNPERACLAVTYVTPSEDAGTTVIHLDDEKKKSRVGGGGNSFEIRKRRTVR